MTDSPLPVVMRAVVAALVLATGRELLGPDLGSVPAAVAVTIAECAVALLASWALYEWVEKPCVRRWSKPRGRVAPVQEKPVAVG